MNKINKSSFLILIILLISFSVIYRHVIFNGKILFPSNFLVQFYSPWSTEKIKGWEHGVPNKPIGDDQIRVFYPSRTFTNKMLVSNNFPLWNPYEFSGTPHIADFQSAVFYPLNILYFFLPQITAWSILLFIQPLMAMFFMYFFLKQFKLETNSAWIGSIAYGLSGFMLVWSQENMVVGQAALWLPLCLASIRLYFETKKIRYYLLGSIALASSFLAGFFQVTFYIFVFSFLYGLYIIYNLKTTSKIKNYTILISFYVSSLALSAVQLFPSIIGFMESPRSSSNVWYLFKTYLLPVSHIFTAIAPDIYGNPGYYNFFGVGFYRETILYVGVIPFIFAIFAIFKHWKNASVRFFAIAALISFFLTLNSFFTQWLFKLPLPLLPTFLPSRILIITAFSFSTLSSFGLSHWLKEDRKKTIASMLFIHTIVIATVLILATFALVSFKFPNPFSQTILEYFTGRRGIKLDANLLIMLKNLILPFIMLLLSLVLSTILNINKRILLIAIILTTLFGQIYFLNKYFVEGSPEFLYPKNNVLSFMQKRGDLFRFASFGRSIQENVSTQFQIYTTDGVNAIFPRRYGQLLFASQNNGQIIRNIPRVEVKLSEDGNSDNLFNYRRLRLFSILGVRYVFLYKEEGVVNKSFVHEDTLSQIWQSNNWFGYEYKNVAPRAFLADSIYVERNDQKIADRIFEKNFNPLSDIVLEEKPKELSKFSTNHIVLKKNGEETSVKITLYQPQRIEITTNSDAPKMLFISDNFYPEWKAYVDGRETKIYRADFTLRSVFVPKGSHSVKFIYDPESFKYGLYISIVTLTVFLGLTFYSLKRKFL